jgi:hypothetical protein
MFSEDEKIIGTKRWTAFQRSCSLAGEFAVAQAKEAGIPFSYIEDGWIVREYPDGRKEKLHKSSSKFIPVETKVWKLPKVEA